MYKSQAQSFFPSSENSQVQCFSSPVIKMDIRNFFGSSSSKSATSSLREGSESEEDSTNEAPPSKRPCAVPSSAEPLGNTTRSGQKIFHG